MKILNNLKKKYALLSISTACSLLVTSMPVRLMNTNSVEEKGYEVVEDNIIDNIILTTTINTTSTKSTSTLISGQTTITPTSTTTSNTEVTEVNTIQNFESPLVNNSINTMEEVIESTTTTIAPTTSITTTTTTVPPTTTTTATTIAVTTTTKPVETSIDSTTSTTIATATTNNKEEDIYVVYKPSTYYIHTNKCRWYDSTCKKIENTEGLEVRKCSECNPDMEIVKEYEPTVDTNTTASSYGLSDYDIMLLRKIVSSEYGADWVPVAEKAKIVASVMAMVRNPRFPNTISEVLAVACEPWGFNRYRNYYMSDSIIAAVDYYFANQNTVFANWCYTSWYGDGRYNHFYC